MRKRILLVLLSVFICAFSLDSQDKGLLTLTLTPCVNLPLGQTSEYFRLGGGGGIWIDFVLPRIPVLALKTHTSYDYLPFGEASADPHPGWNKASCNPQSVPFVSAPGDEHVSSALLGLPESCVSCSECSA